MRILADESPTIPGYELTKPLGSGGQASVYLGTQLSMNRPVAVKVILPTDDAQATELGRFLREARVLARMRHDNIVQAIDFGEAKGVRYLVMEHVEGPTVLELIQEKGALGVKPSCDIALQVCRALEHASKFDVVHRDIKPANILIEGGKRAVLVDFGLAKPEQSDMQVTMAGVSVGTPHYMPPEQIRGTDSLDLRADIYALGGTFYHMLTGRVPFPKHDKTQILISHLKDPITLPEDFEGNIPDYVFSIVLKSMEKDREKRYQKPAEMIADLENALARLKVGGAKRVSTRRRPQTTAADKAAPERIQKLTEERDQLAKERQALINRGEEIRKKAQEIIHRKNRELEEARSEILSLQDKLEDAVGAAENSGGGADPGARLEAVLEESETLKQRLKSAEQFVRELEEKSKSQEEAASRQVQSLAKERDSLRAAVEERDRRLQENRTSAVKAGEERETLTRQCEALRRQVAKIQESPQDRTGDEASAKLAELQAEAKSLRAAKEAAEARVAELVARLKEQEAKQTTERHELEAQIRKAEELAAQADDAPLAVAEELGDIDEITGELEAQIEALQRASSEEIERLEVERDEALRRAKEFEERVGSAEDSREEALKRARAFEERVTSAEETRKEAVKRAEELEQRNHAAEKEKEALVARVADLSRRLEAASRAPADSDELAARLAATQQARLDLENRVEELEKVDARLRAEVEGTRTEADRKVETMRRKAAAAETEWRERFSEATRERDEFEIRLRELEQRLAKPEDEEDEAPENAERPSKVPKDAKEPAKYAPMAFISRGEFLAGEDEGADVETPKQTMELGSFWIDVYPVTNRQYAEFIEETGHAPPSHWHGSAPPEKRLDHPVVMVTWTDAREFAKWCGKRLPTLLEWQKAARGVDGRSFPWGDEWDTERANCKESELGTTSFVGAFPTGVSPYGMHDAAGNVAEWVEGEFKVSGGGQGGQVIRAVCGGSWRDPLARSRCASRRGYPDGGKAPYVGFRCARDP